MIEELIEQLIKTKDTADGKIAIFACQGQAMDGYSELAEYRNFIEKIRTEVKENLENKNENAC